MELDQKVAQLQKDFEQDIVKYYANGDLDGLYLKYFSKTNGLTTLLLKELVKLSPEDKKAFGPKVNALSEDQKNKIELARKEYAQKQIEDPLIDLTIPAKVPELGYYHPITQTVREIQKFFRYYGFSIAEGPEIETVEYNFRKLNLPEGHPATDLQDTLFLSEPNIMLRTHTSSVETRLLTNYADKLPLRAAFTGKVFRNETPSKTNGAFFHQVQGVVVDKGITIQNLKATLELFHKFLFGEDTKLRFRYKYYPEVSPGLGVDMECRFCNGKGCDVCKQRGYIEVLGSGMIHYNTLKACGIDPEVYTGFAFGMGLDRLAMQKFGIDDLRSLFGGGIVYK